MKSPTKSQLTKNNGVLDKLWRSVGKEGAVCEICETLPVSERVNYTQLHPHHIIGRVNKLFRWDLRNRIWLCPTHHTFGVQSAHNDQMWFERWMKKHRLSDWKYLEKNNKPYKQWTLDELLIIYKKLCSKKS